MKEKTCVVAGYTLSEMSDHVALLRGVYAPFVDLSPSLVGLEDCQIPFIHLRNKKTVTEEHLARHFLGLQ